MARDTVTLTNSFQQIAAKAAVFYVQSADATAVIVFNETATDTDAYADKVHHGAQYTQNEAKATFARVSVGNATLLVDEEG